jgi:hypothetical protein
MLFAQECNSRLGLYEQEEQQRFRAVAARG